MRIQNLPQLTAKVLINSVVMDTVYIGIEVSNPVSGGYTIYDPTMNTSKDKSLAETEVKDYLSTPCIAISYSSSFFCSSGETF